MSSKNDSEPQNGEPLPVLSKLSQLSRTQTDLGSPRRSTDAPRTIPALENLRKSSHSSRKSSGDLTSPARQNSEMNYVPVDPSSPALRKQEIGGRILDKKWEDFSDGVKLIQLLEIIGNDSLGKYYKNPKLKVQKCENMNKALDYIKMRGVNLTNIGAEDLVDNNDKLYLGMIWTIILRFTIAEISQEGLTAKEGLLLWCQRKTAGYKNVSVKDFTFSWQDGLALCALIHKHRPDLLNFDELSKNKRKENVSLAFDIGEKYLSIPKLFDVDDLINPNCRPDERSVMTYIAQYFHAFSALDKVDVAGRRVAKFANFVKQNCDMQHEYEKRAAAFKVNVSGIMDSWKSHSFSGTYQEARNQSNEFLLYKNSSKREWVKEKRELENLLGNIQTKLKTYNLSPYTPPNDFALSTLDSCWAILLNAEGERRKIINERMQACKEKLRIEYSDLANKFSADVNALSGKLGILSGDLSDQLEEVKKLISETLEMDVRLEKIREVNAVCEEAGLDECEREYTVFSVEDLEFDYGIVKVSLQKKTGFIENQMVSRTKTNLTPQQLEEFDQTFRAFDKDNTNTLNKLEFRACLNSLGIEENDDEFEKLYSRITENQEFLTFEKFINYMVSVTEDKFSPAQLKQSFLIISNQKEFVTETDLVQSQLPPDQVHYLKSVLPKKEGRDNEYDFGKYLNNVFLIQ